MSRPRRRVAIALIGLFALLAVACSTSSQARGWAAPVQAGNALIVSTGHGHIDGIDAQTKAQLWRFPDRWSVSDSKAKKLAGVYGAPVVSSDGKTVFVGDYNDYVYAFRPGDLPSNSGGSNPRAAAIKLPGPVLGGLVLGGDGTLFVTAADSVYAIKTAELIGLIDNKDAKVTAGLLRKTGANIWSAPLIQGSNVIIASLDGSLYAVDATTGKLSWSYNGARALVSTPVVAGNLLLVGGFDSKLHAIDAATGTQRWEYGAKDWVWSAATVDSNRAYVGDFSGTVYAINLSDGSLAWSSKVADGPIVGAPALASGVLVVASEAGTVYGIDTATQQQRWQAQNLGTSLTANLLAVSNTIYLAPSGCVTPAGTSDKTYYLSLSAQSGELSTASGVC